MKSDSQKSTRNPGGVLVSSGRIPPGVLVSPGRIPPGVLVSPGKSWRTTGIPPGLCGGV